MKISKYKWHIVVMLVSLFYMNGLVGQPFTIPAGAVPFECRILPQSTSSVQGSATCTPDFLTNYDAAPIINVYVNVHIWNTNENLSTATMVSRVRQMITACNETLDNMQQNYRNGPGGVPAPRVEDAKFRLKLYSDLTAQPMDVNGGIWVYPTVLMFPLTTNILTLGPNATQFPGYFRRYGNNAIDILLVNYGAKPNPLPPPNFTANNTAYVTGPGGNYVIAADLNGAFQADALNGTTITGNLIWRSVARALNHEIAHILSLRHTYECNYNQCNDVDISEECGSSCLGFRNCGGANNSTVCPGSSPPRSICTYGHSWNIMAYDWWQHTITRCQWERIYDYAINTSFAAIRGCATNTMLTLPTSPQADYRASQQITSTSVINTNRDVTYQSSLIRLNPGFRVALGAAFLAAPSTFPCCDAPPAITSPEETQLALQNNDEREKDFQIFPNPFDHEITIRFPKESTFHGTETQLDVIDVNGQIIHSLKVSSSDDTIISTKNFAPGLYMIRLTQGSMQQSYQAIKL